MEGCRIKGTPNAVGVVGGRSADALWARAQMSRKPEPRGKMVRLSYVAASDCVCWQESERQERVRGMSYSREALKGLEDGFLGLEGKCNDLDSSYVMREFSNERGAGDRTSWALPAPWPDDAMYQTCCAHFHVAAAKKDISDSGLSGICATFFFGGRPYPMTGFSAATSVADHELRLSALSLWPTRGWARAGISRVPGLPWIAPQLRLLPRV